MRTNLREIQSTRSTVKARYPLVGKTSSASNTFRVLGHSFGPPPPRGVSQRRPPLNAIQHQHHIPISPACAYTYRSTSRFQFNERSLGSCGAGWIIQMVPLRLLTVCAVCIVIVHGTSLVRPTDTLTPSDQQFWQSSNTDFSFGFHPTGNDGLFVLGVGFKDSSLVWTAGNDGNGGIVINDKASFHFNADGNLVLLDGTKRVLWQSNSGNKGAVSATMNDTGNFVVQNKRNATVWDTFSNPTDTLLIDQVFGAGKTLRVNSYSFSLQSNGNLTLKWNDSITYWNVGQSQANATANASISLDNQGRFTLSNSSGAQLWIAYSNDYTDNSITMRWIKLDPDGNLRTYGWENGTGSWRVGWAAVEDQCLVYGWCGNFGMCVYNETTPFCMCPTADFVAVDPKDPTKGCKRERDIATCANNQSMVELQNTMFLSYPPESLSNVFRSGDSACEQNCLKAQTCVASTAVSDGSGTCEMKLTNFSSAYKSPTLQSISYIKICGSGRPPPPPPPPHSRPTSTKVSVPGIIIAVVGTAVALVIVETGFWWLCCRNNPRFQRSSAQYTLLEYASGAPVQFSYRELHRSTKNFREKVGTGGFGAVYKGTLPNQSVIAVKRLEGIEQGEKQFRMEVAIIGSTHHYNLARLIGFCSEGRHRLLVYEFMKNTSLDSFLFASGEKTRKLDWETRFNIALGTARGIAYLHEECRDCIIHCDIKPENILLDDNLNAKVSDFGLAKLINSRDRRNRSMSSVRGTRGYLAPEWLANLPITSKSDVFSYGMVLLEIISGRRNFDVSVTTGRRRFSTWAFEEFESGNIVNIVDEKLDGHINVEEVERAIRVCFWCIQEQPSQRPSMGKVVRMLEGVLLVEKPPAPKSFEGLQSSATTSRTTISVLATSPPPASYASSTDIIQSATSVHNNEDETLSSSK